MLFLLSYFVFSTVKQYEPPLFYLLNPEDKSTLSFFYDKNTKNINDYLNVIDRVDQYSEGFEIVTVNCSNYLSLCSNRHVDPLPSVGLFIPNRDRVIMSYEFSLYSIIKFVTARVQSAKSFLPPSQVHVLDAKNYSSIFNNGDYHIIEFIQKGDDMSDMLDMSFEEISNIYKDEIDMKFGKVDCSNDIDFCLHIGALEIPIIRIFHENEYWTYQGIREIPYILDFINLQCKKNRKYDGSYSFEFSVDIENTIRDFMKTVDKKICIEHIEELSKNDPNHHFYHSIVVIMNRILKDGDKVIETQKNNLLSLLMNKNIKNESQENVAEKLEILNLFQKYTPFVSPKDEL